MSTYAAHIYVSHGWVSGYPNMGDRPVYRTIRRGAQFELWPWSCTGCTVCTLYALSTARNRPSKAKIVHYGSTHTWIHRRFGFAKLARTWRQKRTGLGLVYGSNVWLHGSCKLGIVGGRLMWAGVGAMDAVYGQE